MDKTKYLHYYPKHFLKKFGNFKYVFDMKKNILSTEKTSYEHVGSMKAFNKEMMSDIARFETSITKVENDFINMFKWEKMTGEYEGIEIIKSQTFVNKIIREFANLQMKRSITPHNEYSGTTTLDDDVKGVSDNDGMYFVRLLDGIGIFQGDVFDKREISCFIIPHRELPFYDPGYYIYKREDGNTMYMQLSSVQTVIFTQSKEEEELLNNKISENEFEIKKYVHKVMLSSPYCRNVYFTEKPSKDDLHFLFNVSKEKWDKHLTGMVILSNTKLTFSDGEKMHTVNQGENISEYYVNLYGGKWTVYINGIKSSNVLFKKGLRVITTSSIGVVAVMT